MPVDPLTIGLILAMAGSPRADSPRDLPRSEVLPSAELLEFLGAWSTDDGEWVAPEMFEQMNVPELNNTAPDERATEQRQTPRQGQEGRL